MAVQSIAQLKAWFRKGLYPTERQFADLIDSFRHKNDPIDVADISILSQALNGKFDASEGNALSERVDTFEHSLERILTELEDQRELIRDLSNRLAALESYNQLKILTQAEFDALAAKDDKVLYIVDDGTSSANALQANEMPGLMNDMEQEMDLTYSYMDAMGAVVDPETISPTDAVSTDEIETVDVDEINDVTNTDKSKDDDNL